ncbi:MAG: hypothetical protein KGD64_07290 [Candidatus Heimdallarchaeota archaeon]|nr:hypothetical protein [Candidatus Heimdallarchaeota archaeon]
MPKKVKKIIFSIVFYLFLVSPYLIRGADSSYTFTEIGSIAPTKDIIQLICSDDLAFLSEINTGLGVYNITNPSDCPQLDSYPLSFVHDIALDFERKLVFITASTGVNIFDFSDPNDISLISSYLNYTTSTFLQLKGELLFIGAEDSGLQVVNVTDPSAPEMISKWEDDVGHVGPLYVLDNYIFVGTRLPNVNAPPTILDLKVLDISDPVNITFVGVVDTGAGYEGGVPKAHIDDMVFLNDYDAGLKILNFTDPTDISVIGVYSDGGSFNDVELVSNNILYLADDGEGLKEVDYSDPENPFLVDSYSHEWRTIRIIVQENRIYLATLAGGVRILTKDNNTSETTSYSFCILSSILVASYLLHKKRKNTS